MAFLGTSSRVKVLRIVLYRRLSVHVLREHLAEMGELLLTKSWRIPAIMSASSSALVETISWVTGWVVDSVETRSG